jgi:hypothetical protein
MGRRVLYEVVHIQQQNCLPLVPMSSRKSMAVVLLASVLASCGERQAEWDHYDQFVRMDRSLRAQAVANLTPARQVDLFMYAAAKVRPADYSFVEAINLEDSSVIEGLARKISDSNSRAEAFALVYALHRVRPKLLRESPLALEKLPGICEPQYVAPSPCHELNADLARKIAQD